MRQAWDRFAREDARFFILTNPHSASEADFYAQGRETWDASAAGLSRSPGRWKSAPPSISGAVSQRDPGAGRFVRRRHGRGRFGGNGQEGAAAHPQGKPGFEVVSGAISRRLRTAPWTLCTRRLSFSTSRTGRRSRTTSGRWAGSGGAPRPCIWTPGGFRSGEGLSHAPRIFCCRGITGASSDVCPRDSSARAERVRGVGPPHHRGSSRPIRTCTGSLSRSRIIHRRAAS